MSDDASDAIVAAIAEALAPTASAEARATGLLACRTAAARLEPAAPTAPPAGLPAVPGDHVGQMIDLLIARLQRIPPHPRHTAAPTTSPKAARPIPFVPTLRRMR
jgi:hypothetical protein